MILHSRSLPGTDFCHDYGFWRANCHNASNAKKFTHATQCSSYMAKSIEELGNECYYNSWKSFNKPNCPNSASKEGCKEKGNNYFYCHLSQTCIDSAKKCDGVVHCIKGEDEDAEICSHLFHDSATLTCIEPDRPADNVWVKAIMCDGKKECKNGKDEDPEICEKYQVSTAMQTLSCIYPTYIATKNARISTMRHFCWTSLGPLYCYYENAEMTFTHFKGIYFMKLSQFLLNTYFQQF